MKKITCIVVACLAMASIVMADVVRVPLDEATIQAGINAAGTDDTVLVAADTYTGEGNRDISFLGKRIVVMSESGPDLTVIVCEGTSETPHIGFFFSGGEDTLSVLKGFTITGGFAPVIFPEGSAGGGILCNVSSPKIELCYFKYNVASHGAGLMSYQAAPVIRDCVFEENTAYENGGGILCYESSITVSNCDFVKNEVYDADAGGGGFACFDCENIKLKHCLFENNNSLEDAGGALFGGTENVNVDSCLFYGNESYHEGGGAFVGNSAATFTNSIFCGNSASVSSGGMLCDESYITIENCTFVLNEALGTAGILFWAPAGPVDLSNTIIAFNNGPALGTNSPAATYNIECCDIYGNTQGDWAGIWGSYEYINGNMSIDPIFCDLLSGDVALSAQSPCLPDYNSCEVLIGAQGEGCSCCVGMTGNVDCSEEEEPDISDIIRIMDYLYLSRAPLCCPAEANTDGQGVYPLSDPDISDIIKIIDHLYLSRVPLVPCPE